jgi:hypothetical protein
MPRFFLFAFLTAVAVAQTNPNGAAPDTEKKKIRVEGRVLALNGEAVRKATVRLQPAGGIQLAGPGGPGGPTSNQMPSTYSETSDDAGKFVFEDVAPGRYGLTSEKTGFVTQRYGARSDTSPGTPLALESGSELKDVVIQMTPQAVIAGRVTDQDGDPVGEYSRQRVSLRLQQRQADAYAGRRTAGWGRPWRSHWSGRTRGHSHRRPGQFSNWESFSGPLLRERRSEGQRRADQFATGAPRTKYRGSTSE